MLDLTSRVTREPRHQLVGLRETVRFSFRARTRHTEAARRSLPSGAALLVVFLCGCSLTPLAKHTTDFSNATRVAVNGSKDAYRAANRLYFEEQMSAAVLNYDSQPNWDPHSVQPLLTSKQLEVRYLLLDSLKAYARRLSRIENSPKHAHGLDTAATDIGNNLVDLSASLDQALGGSRGLTVSQANANGASTAAKALGQFLIANKVRRELPANITAMDPHIQVICKVLQLDIATLQSQAAADYGNLLTQQDLFIRKSGDKLNPVERRTEIRRLPEILAASEASRTLLDHLQHAIAQLAATHHALANAASGKDLEPLQERIADLQDAGDTLANFYQNLPSS